MLKAPIVGGVNGKKTSSLGWDAIDSLEGAEAWTKQLAGPGSATSGEYEVVEAYLRSRINSFDRRFDSSLIMASIAIAAMLGLTSLAASASLEPWDIGWPFFALIAVLAAAVWLLGSGGFGSARAERALFRLMLIRTRTPGAVTPVAGPLPKVPAVNESVGDRGEDEAVLGGDESEHNPRALRREAEGPADAGAGAR